MSIFDRLRQKKDDKEAAKEAVVEAAGKEVQSPKKEAKTAKKSEKAVEKKTAEKKSTKKATATGSVYQVLVQPIVTEKATMTGTYIFEVAPNANKSEIMKAVETEYGVRPKSVRTMNVRGKAVRWGYRYGKRKNWKKAIVTLNDGDTINVYEGI